MTDLKAIREALDKAIDTSYSEATVEQFKQALSALSRLEAASAPELSREDVVRLTDEEFLSSLDADGIQIDPLLALEIKSRVERFAALARSAPVGEVEPVAWLVCSVNSDRSLSLEHAAAWQEAAHEHINDAITEHGIEEAATWVVRPAYTTPPAPPEGYKLVPVEPTPEMVRALSEVDMPGEWDKADEEDKAETSKHIRSWWAAMLAAAPQPGGT